MMRLSVSSLPWSTRMEGQQLSDVATMSNHLCRIVLSRLQLDWCGRRGPLWRSWSWCCPSWWRRGPTSPSASSSFFFIFSLYRFWLQVMVNNIIATAGLIEVIGLELFCTGTESVIEDQDACKMCTSQIFPYRVEEKMNFTRCFYRNNAILHQVDFKKKALLEWAKPYLARFFDDQIISMRSIIMIPLIKIY